MGAINKSIPVREAGQAFIVTVGIPHGTQAETNRECRMALEALRRAGFEAGPTSDDAIKIIAEQARLIDGIVQNDTRSE